ncbi:MAG: hypothetical protein ACLFQO_14475 [Cyclobacteriaceae bacterium]
MKHQTVSGMIIQEDEYMKNYNYQDRLTGKLDQLTGDFDQAIINEIVLWKVNRYAQLDEESLQLLNRISKEDSLMDTDLTISLLGKLLDTQGIRLPMASTILRFKNPHIYQIIDQRVYRVISQEELKLPSTIMDQISLYLDFLERLREVCKTKAIPFFESDRILYEVDKKVNKNLKLK